MTSKDIAKHLAFYKSLEGKNTRYTMSKHFTGRHTKNIGFNHPMGQTISLFYREDRLEYKSVWIELNFNAALKKLAEEQGISKEELTTFQQYKHNLEYLLHFWKANIPRLAAYCNSQSDIRQLAQIAVILDYKPITSP